MTTHRKTDTRTDKQVTAADHAAQARRPAAKTRATASLWQLAEDRDTYGDRAGWYVLTTPDGNEELAGPWEHVESAHAFATAAGWTLIPLDDDAADKTPERLAILNHDRYGSPILSDAQVDVVVAALRLAARQYDTFANSTPLQAAGYRRASAEARALADELAQ